MSLKKIHIFSLLGILLGGFLFAPKPVSAAYDPKDLTQMSASKFWAEVNELNSEVKDKDYIICGTSVCDPETQKCVVKEDIRADRFTKILGGIETVRDVRGMGLVSTYQYKCVNKADTLEAGWSEAAEGGWVTRKKVRVGGWFGNTVKDKGVCSTGSNEGTYCLAAKNGMATVNYNQANTAFRGCEVLPVKLYNGRKCFFCPLFTVMYKVAGDITSISFRALAPSFAVILLLGLAIWIAVQTLAHVSSLTKQDAPKFLTGLIKQGYKVVIAFFLLQFSSQIFTYGVVPVVSAGIEFGNALLDEKYAAIETDEGLSDMGKMEEENPGILERVSTLSNTNYFNGDLYVKLDNFVVLLQRNISFMQGVGSSLICIGTNALVFKGDIQFKNGFLITIQGILLAGFGFLFALAFAFYLVDAVVQMGIAGALMPFLIACWPFKLTSKYANTGWSMILNSAFVFAFSGLVLSVSLDLIDAALASSATSEEALEGSSSAAENVAVEAGGLYQIAQAINSQSEDELVRLSDISLVGFLILLFCCLFGFKFLGRAGDLAGKFASGALKPIAPSIGTMAGSAAKSFALKATQATREAAWEKVKDGGRALASLPGRAFGAIAGKRNASQNTPAGGAGGGASGGESEDAFDEENTLANEDNVSPEAEDEGSVRVSENSSAAARNVRPRTNQPNRPAPKMSEAARSNSSPTPRMSENLSNPPKANDAAEADRDQNLSERNQLERVRQSGRRRQAGKAQNSSQRGRSKRYGRGRNGRRR